MGGLTWQQLQGVVSVELAGAAKGAPTCICRLTLLHWLWVPLSRGKSLHCVHCVHCCVCCVLATHQHC
jgi:hypothetical protein